jgi:cysteine desulfuration protein SufE
MDLLQNLKELESAEEKYEYLIELGSELPKLSAEQKTNQNRILGCQNRVWLNLENVSEVVMITGESDSRLVSGLIAILINIYSNKTKYAIETIGSDFIQKNDFNLSMTRIKGLNSMLKRIFEF